MFILIQPDEDGNPVRWLNLDDMDQLLVDPQESYGVTKFLTTGDFYAMSRKDPAYWPEGTAMLLSAEVVILEPEVVRYKVKHA